MNAQKKYHYFVSDLHLGAPNAKQSRERELAFVAWLDHIQNSAEAIYLLGDIFDFWFEYKTVIPKGYTRLFGKLAALTDQGIELHFFKGNHDMWVKDYFEQELAMTIHSHHLSLKIDNKLLYLHHGDGLGPGDYKYKLIKFIFRSPLCQWMFARLHPNFGIGLASLLSLRSRAKGGKKDAVYNGPNHEWLYEYAQTKHEQDPHDYFIFGHRHLPLFLPSEQTTYINLGDWLQYQTFGRFDGQSVELLQWHQNEVRTYNGN
jgi:UDP-2,3-diacylglucosamine hydrolase